MTSAAAREQGVQRPLMQVLLGAGARATPAAIDAALGHREREAVCALLEAGQPLTAPIAAALGRTDVLGALLRDASADERQRALGLAVINGELAAARSALDAGADPNRFLPVHAHSLPLHSAALDENLELLQLLVERGARPDAVDTLWHGTPLDWAIHEGKARSRAFLERLRDGAR
jgi:hypothetical protein